MATIGADEAEALAPAAAATRGLNAEEAELAVDKDAKMRVTTVLKVAAFVDLAGLVLLAPAYNQMALTATGAPNVTIPDSSFPNPGGTYLPDYSLAVMLFTMCSSLGGAIGNPITGRLSDSKGRKFVILLCLTGGTASYVIMYLAGAVVEDYYMFLGGCFVNGLFGGSRGAIQAYLMDVWGREFPKIQPGLYSVFMYGGAGGGMLGMLILLIVIPLDITGALFIPALVAAALSTTCALTVYFQCPEPPRKVGPPKENMVFSKVHTKVYVNDKNQVASNSAGPWAKTSVCSDKLAQGEYDICNEIKGVLKERVYVTLTIGSEKQIRNPVKPRDAGGVEVPKKVNTILWTFILAGSLDNFGDSGTSFARSALMTKKWPFSSGIELQGCLVIVMILMIKISMELIVRNSMIKQPRIQLKWWTLVGNFCTSIFQYIMIPIMMAQCSGYCSGSDGMGSFVGFLGVWSMSKLFGFTSTLAAMFMLPMYAPAESRGAWLGRNSGVQSATAVVTPIVLWAIEKVAFTSTNPTAGGTAVLATCGTVSLLAALWYFIGVVLNVPRPQKPLPLSVETLDHYLAMPAAAFGMLPFSERMAVNAELQSDQKSIIHVPWGSYSEDVPHLQTMLDRAPEEFSHLRNHMLGLLTNKAALIEGHGKIAQYYKDIDANFDQDKERVEFGNWMADYMDDAGYSSWIQYPDMYKALVMNAFPPLEELDDLNFGRTKGLSLADYEIRMMKWMEVLDMHIGSNKKHHKTSSLVATTYCHHIYMSVCMNRVQLFFHRLFRGHPPARAQR